MRSSPRTLVLVTLFALNAVACGAPSEETALEEDDHGSHADVGGAGEELDDGLGELLNDASPTEDAAPSKTPICDADAKAGDYCGGDKISNADPKTLYHCTGPGAKPTVVKVCAAGCVVAPAGSDDYCKATTPTTPAVEACPHVASLLKWGLHPIASDRLRCAGITAARITQTIGSAAASAGTHAQDGTVDGKPYSAATDLSVSGLTDAQVKTLIAKLDTLGFAAFYRKPGYDGWPSSEARHIHAVFAGAKMKSSLQAQIWDFLAGKNGLASHTAYTFYQPPADIKAFIKAIFLAANPG